MVAAARMTISLGTGADTGTALRAPDSTIMPHFYFDVDDGARVSPDTDGRELASLEDARGQALHMLGEIAKTEMRDGNRSQERIFIRDDGGKVLLTVSVVVED